MFQIYTFFRYLRITIQLLMLTNHSKHKLARKYLLDQSFQLKMDRIGDKYQEIWQQSKSAASISSLDGLLVKLPQKEQDIYCFYACKYNDPSQRNLHILMMYLIKNLEHNPQRDFTFVFFNNHAKAGVYGQLKHILLKLTLKHFIHLKKLYLVRPSQYHKAQDLIVFNTLSNYLKSKTKYLSNSLQLCKVLKISTKEIIDIVPALIAKQDFPNIDSSRGLGQYQRSKKGIPIILQILLTSFTSNPMNAKAQGLFRKSIAIDQQNEMLVHLENKDYQSLLKIKNPYAIASLIKYFFAKLQSPLIPYHFYNKMMRDEKLLQNKQQLRTIVQKLPRINYLSLKEICCFLAGQIIPYQQNNMMNAKNLSICFAPCLMWSEKSSPQDIIFANKSSQVCRNLLENIDYFFDNTSHRAQVYRLSERSHSLNKLFEKRISTHKQHERHFYSESQQSSSNYPISNINPAKKSIQAKYSSQKISMISIITYTTKSELFLATRSKKRRPKIQI